MILANYVNLYQLSCLHITTLAVMLFLPYYIIIKLGR